MLGGMCINTNSMYVQKSVTCSWTQWIVQRPLFALRILEHVWPSSAPVARKMCTLPLQIVPTLNSSIVGPTENVVVASQLLRGCGLDQEIQHLCALMCECVHVCMHVCVHVCVHTCVYV